MSVTSSLSFSEHRATLQLHTERTRSYGANKIFICHIGSHFKNEAIRGAVYTPVELNLLHHPPLIPQREAGSPFRT